MREGRGEQGGRTVGSETMVDKVWERASVMWVLVLGLMISSGRCVMVAGV